MIPVATLDAAMLIAETAEMPLHNVGVMVFAPPERPLSSPFEARRAMIASRLHRVPAFRRKLVRDPYRLGDLQWTDDAAFTLERHLVRATLPSPGGDEELRAFVGEYAARLLGRDRPLWEIVLVEGLATGELVALAKIHHAAMDGSRLATLLGDLFDRDASEAHFTSPAELREREPGIVRITLAAARSLVAKPRKVLRAAREVAGALSRSVRPSSDRSVPRETESLRVPSTPWAGSLSVRRSVAFATVRLDDVRSIARAFDTTINDVVLAASAATLRRWLLARGSVPTRDLVANVPVAVSDPGDDAGNHVSMLRVRLPMDDLDSETRLLRIHRDTTRAKRHHRTSGANTYLRLADLVLALTVPRALASAVSFYARARLADYHPALWNVVISNVPGPRAPLYCGGSRLLRIHPLGPVQHGSGLNLTVMSTHDELGLGVIACAERVPHVDELASGFVDEILRLAALARARPSSSP